MVFFMDQVKLNNSSLVEVNKNHSSQRVPSELTETADPIPTARSHSNASLRRMKTETPSHPIHSFVATADLPNTAEALEWLKSHFTMPGTASLTLDQTDYYGRRDWYTMTISPQWISQMQDSLRDYLSQKTSDDTSLHVVQYGPISHRITRQKTNSNQPFNLPELRTGFDIVVTDVEMKSSTFIEGNEVVQRREWFVTLESPSFQRFLQNFPDRYGRLIEVGHWPVKLLVASEEKRIHI